MISSDRDWRIGCPGAQLDKMRTNREFHQVLALARLLNALRFAQVSFSHADDLVGPAATRQRINGFFLMNALLFEGLKLAQGMARDFRNHVAWGSGLGVILKNPQFCDLFSENLKAARDKVTFHIDEAEISRLVGEFPTDDVTLVWGRGSKVHDTYYDLSDLLAIRTFVGPAPSHEELTSRFSELLPVARDMAVAFLGAAERLVMAVLRDMGFTCSTIESNSAGE